MDSFATVLIATANRADLLPRCLETIGQSSGLTSPLAVWIVDNGTTSQWNEEWRRWESTKVRFVYEHFPLQNKSVALNLALAQVDTPLVIFFDDDVTVARDTVATYIHSANSKQKGWFFGGPVLANQEQAPPAWLNRFLEHAAKGWQPGSEEQEIKAPDFIGSNWAAFTKELLWLGGFDSRFGPGGTTGATGQETDMQSRLLKAGVRAQYLPSAQVNHFVPHERCSQEWAIHRAYRRGIYYGIKSAARWRSLWSVGGTTILYCHQARLLLTEVLPGNHLQLFKARYAREKWRGFVSGIKVSRVENCKLSWRET